MIWRTRKQVVTVCKLEGNRYKHKIVRAIIDGKFVGWTRILVTTP